MKTSKKGFTLIELTVVVLIIGILAALGVPQYLKTVEGTKADSAIASAHMVASANRMFSIDNSGKYAQGGPFTTCPETPGTCVSGGTSVCNLMSCNYLAGQDWKRSAYDYYACDPGSGGGGCCMTKPDTVACAIRKSDGSVHGGVWGYSFSRHGVCTAFGGAPECMGF